MRKQSIRRLLRSGYWLTFFLILQCMTPAFAAALSDAQFHKFTGHDIDIQLNGRGRNTTNSYGTYSPGMTAASNDLRAVILAHERTQATAHTVNVQALARCQFISTGLELDNIRRTQEWLVTTQDGCTPTSPFGLKTFWLVQGTPSGNTMYSAVLMAERGQKRVFIPKQTNASGYRPLSLRIRNGQVNVNNAQGTQRYKANCKKYWQVHNGRYTSQAENIEVRALDPVTNSNNWVDIRHAFKGQTVTLPTACLRY